MAGSNILTRKQLRKMSKNWLTDFAMKVQEKLISTVNALSNENKEINSQLHNRDIKTNQLKKENNIAENILILLSKNHIEHTEKIIDLEKNIHKMDQYSQ